MKRVKYEYGARACGYVSAEIYVPEEMTEEEIKAQITEDAELGLWIYEIESGYEPQTETVYKKSENS